MSRRSRGLPRRGPLPPASDATKASAPMARGTRQGRAADGDGRAVARVQSPPALLRRGRRSGDPARRQGVGGLGRGAVPGQVRRAGVGRDDQGHHQRLAGRLSAPRTCRCGGATAGRAAWLDLGSPDPCRSPRSTMTPCPHPSSAPSGTLGMPVLEGRGPEAIEEPRTFLGLRARHLWACCVAWWMARSRPRCATRCSSSRARRTAQGTLLGELFGWSSTPGVRAAGVAERSGSAAEPGDPGRACTCFFYDNISGPDGDPARCLLPDCHGRRPPSARFLPDRDQVVSVRRGRCCSRRSWTRWQRPGPTVAVADRAAPGASHGGRTQGHRRRSWKAG